MQESQQTQSGTNKRNVIARHLTEFQRQRENRSEGRTLNLKKELQLYCTRFLNSSNESEKTVTQNLEATERKQLSPELFHQLKCH